MSSTRSAICIAVLLAIAGCGSDGDSAVSGNPPANAPDETPDAGEAPDDPTITPDLTPGTLPGLVPVTNPTTGNTPTPEPNPEQTPEPPPEQTPEPPPEQTPANGAQIDMTLPVNQTMTCRYGIKPYYDTTLSGDWTIAFDGDALSLTSFAGGTFTPFGGKFSSTILFSRENYSTAALIRGALGGSGTEGWIYFVKDISGKLLSAGHNGFGGNNPRFDSVECGGNTATQWTPTPASTPFASALAWVAGTLPMNCARKTGEGPFGDLFDANLVLAAPDAIEMRSADQTSLFALPSFGTNRDAGIVASGKVVKGGTVSHSRPLGDPAAAGAFFVSLGLSASKHPTQVSRHGADGSYVGCWPRPVDGRF